MNPNPYYQNWSYGYTLAPDTEQSRGAYTMYGQVQGSNQANLSTIQPHGAGTWAQIKQEYPNSGIKNQMFVTSSNSTLKSEVEEQMIGPVKPASEPPAQIDPVKALAKLHELAFTNKLVERFEKVQDPEAGNPQMTEYVVKLFIGTEEYEGRGTNLKCARQNAALKALSNTKYQTAKEKKLTMFNTAKRIGVTATSELHEIAAKKGVHVDFKFLEPYNFEFKHSMRMWSKKDMLGNYRVQLNVAGYEFYGQAELPQQAKHNASTQALPIVRQMADPSGAGKVIAKPGGLPIPEEEESVPVSGDVKNTTMLLNEIAMTNNCTPEWTLLSETGPAHARIYTWQLKIGEFATIGSGPSKKMARQGAADQMLATLPEEWKAKARKSVSGRFTKRKAGQRMGRGPPNKKPVVEGENFVIAATNPVSCLHEYAKKKKIPDPCFNVVSENVLETVQKGPHSFKKVEYTLQLNLEGRIYSASAHTKKAAKTLCASEAWDFVRQTLGQ